MKLKTLGGLRLESSPFTQPKPLLLLSYLALEGPQQRRHLAELFWQGGKRMKSLSMTLTRLRQGAGKVAHADDKRVWTSLESDAGALLGALDKRDWQGVSDLYSGAFLAGVVLEDWSSELEEWVYKTREHLAQRVQYALLKLAEEAAKKQDFGGGASFAERAYKLPGLGGSDVAILRRLYLLFCAGNSPLASEVRKEAEDYGITLKLSSEKARAKFKPEKTATVALPMRGTSFIGRDVELTELATLLNREKVSLLTLLGPAGVGKTRLALQLAFEQLKLGAFKDGVYFIPLDALSDAQLIPSSLIVQLGLSQQAQGEPLEQVIGFIGERKMLLVLDNFEHVGEGSRFLPPLLGKCPNLKVLITSRERLRLEEECLFPVEGLPYPATLTEDAMLCDAVQLFKDRAEKAQPHFDLGHELADVIRICRLVEGLPLGIELAAAWVRIMSCADIAGEIAKNLEFLSSSTQNIPERHRSLKATFESSWTRLSQKEQDVLKKLSVFRGGFRREAATTVAGATIPVLASLVDKSLLRVLSGGRYDRHPLLYQYAREKLLEADELPKVEAEHEGYYLRLVQAQEGAVQQGRQEDALRVFQEEWENCQLMAERILEGDAQTLLRWIDLVDTFYDIRGAYREALAYLSRAEARLAGKREARALLGRVLLEKGWSLTWLGAYEEATADVQRGLACIPETQQRWRLRGLNTLGIVAFNQGRYSEALAYWQEALELARATDYTIYQAHITGNLGIVQTERGSLQTSESYHLESLRLYQQLGAVNGYAREQMNIATTYYLQGDLVKAIEAASEGLRLARDIDYKLFVPYGLTGLARVDYALGNYLQARDLNVEALELSRETQDAYVEIEALTGLAFASTALLDYAAASAYSEQAIEFARNLGSDSKLMGAILSRVDLLAALGHYEHATKLVAIVLYHPATVSYERAFAEKLLAAMKSNLTSGQQTSAEEFARTIPLEKALEDAIKYPLT